MIQKSMFSGYMISLQFPETRSAYGIPRGGLVVSVENCVFLHVGHDPELDIMLEDAFISVLLQAWEALDVVSLDADMREVPRP